MTLTDVIPSLRYSARARLEPGIWPASAALTDRGDLTIGGVSAVDIAARFGTPAYVLDEDEVRQHCRDYHRALPGVEVAYAGKAFLCRAMARWMCEEGMSLDVCSAGELAVARSAGFPAARILLHGNVKTAEDLKAAQSYGVGRIVVDSLDEISQLGLLAQRRQQVLVRVTPGVDGHTHAAIATGVEDQKFGFSLASGAAEEAVRAVLAQPSLELVGLHCHIGSQITRVASFEEAARRMVRLLHDLRIKYGVTLPQLNLGGGHAVRYLSGDGDFDLDGFAHRLKVAVNFECARLGFPVPALTIEPGRSVVAKAGVTFYRVIAVKHVPGVRTWVAVDGGMSDNLRPALYDAQYVVRMVGRTSRENSAPMTVVGRHCEAGDIIARDVPLPADIHAGDLLAVPCTGAYHHSLASNYNAVARPPVVAVSGGAPRLIVRRESEEDLLGRDCG
ncbi:diaminopimelate decarboxylase [Pseudonocardiaceae bacterium YIM PH 21723]|nr:diaminopimelate decarboxylase [Pseudonocardiaceae bacterium YIM PH 21723]